MNAPKLQELLLLLLSASVSAAGESALAQQQAECSGQETSKTLYVGVYIATDSLFRLCSPYKDQTLTDYLQAFVGGMELYFRELTSPSIHIVYQGSRDLKDDEERNIIGSVKGTTDIAVKGPNALKEMTNIRLEMNDEDYITANTLFLVLTGLNITEEETKNIVNTAMPVPGNSDGDNDDEYDVYSLEDTKLYARADPKRRLHDNVGGLSIYGSMCPMAVAIVQDYGKNFSGVAAAAKQTANVLGPMYHGTIARRDCSEDDIGQQSFHGSECSGVKTLAHDKAKFDCLEIEINGTMGEVKTPSDFYTRHTGWTPCGTSYTGTEECKKPKGTTYQHTNCSISCCLDSSLRSFMSSYNTIPAPDGEKCDSRKVCIGGNCVTTNAISDEYPLKP